ncbi:MAG: hypothetical protein Q8K18_18470 [Burkholderiales bacterium]|nr:hypothetical protein [Burkholderiales bacterium]
MNTFQDSAEDTATAAAELEQIAQAAPRQALHIAKVAALALHRSRNAEAASR